MSAPAAFDVRAYMRDPWDLRPADVYLGAVAGLPAPVLDALVHLWSVERAALERMRDVLVTPAHADPRVTAFLTTWTYEQYWLAETLRAVLEANGCTVREPADTPAGRFRRAWDERCRPVLGAVVSNLLGADVIGAQLAVGWLDTAVLALVHRRLGAIDPRLAELSGEVVRVKERHLAFCAEEAAARLADGARARRLARNAVARWRWPGTRYAGPGPVGAVLVHLVADPGCRAAVAEIDGVAAGLPGLSGAGPVLRELDRLVLPGR